MWIKPIYDRTQEDIDRIKYLNEKVQTLTATTEELAEWRGDLKGAINKNDLERIINDMKEIADSLSINIDSLTVPEIPTASWYKNLLKQLTTLYNSYIVHTDTPTVPKQPLNTYEKWNAIEHILNDLYDTISNSYVSYCGAGDLIANNNALI